MPDTTDKTNPEDRPVVTLNTMPANVVGMGHKQDDPCIMVGATLDSPFGPCVVIGAGMKLPGQATGLALAAHLDPDAAIDLAGQLVLAASTVLEAQGKGGRA